MRKIKNALNWIKNFGLINYIKFFILVRKKDKTKYHELIETILRKNISNTLVKYKGLGVNDKLPAEKIIWSLWWRGENDLYPISKAGLNSIRQNAGDYNVILLCKDNIEKYVHIQPKIYELIDKKLLPLANFCDILRINILNTYGGIWLDPTVFMSKSLPTDIANYSLYTAKRDEKNVNSITNGKWTGYFFATNEKNNMLFEFLCDCYEEYYKKHDIVITYFMLDYLIDIAKNEFENVKTSLEKIPFNNPKIKCLNRVLNEEFNESYWQELIKDTTFFKMDWKSYNDSFLDNKNNYYNRKVNVNKKV